MQLLSPAFFIAISLALTQTVATEPVLDDAGLLSRDSTEINVHIEIESPHDLENITIAVVNTTHSSLGAGGSS
ncbi:hypothetical protein K469DRAFT_701320 [Zopfia rhizophila CBS 207.26]|uniref:Uncharacterized protein n=1 Tax=Zopfia rhizophila CBS 207.26 TaxID=1314779 RepID=A0A6A6DCD9_9PEZI|nr:hypothetical protein K469DRAFT_701320 [Zopfia rhizophila CBS 207.26]